MYCAFRGAGNSVTSLVASSRFGLLGCHTLAVQGISSCNTPHFLPAMQYSDAKKETHFAAGVLSAWAELLASE
jgi:hypothetical protein